MNNNRFERNAKDRMKCLQEIDSKLLERFREKVELHLMVKDMDLRRWGMEINAKSDNKIDGFRASKMWLVRFKTRNKIVSRKVSRIF